MTFETYGDITDAIIEAIADKITGLTVKSHYSNQSPSAYLEISDGEDFFFKLRVSDHADRYGSDCTVRIDGKMTDIEDDCGEYIECEVEEWKFEEMVKEGLEAITSAQVTA